MIAFITDHRWLIVVLTWAPLAAFWIGVAQSSRGQRIADRINEVHD